MTKHERALETAMDKITKIVENGRQKYVPNYRSNSENKTYKNEI